MTIFCFDASASIPTSTPDGCTAVLGYLNSKEAADPWTLADWLRFEHLRQLPAWVAELWKDRTVDQYAAAQAEQAVAQVAGLGWHEGRGIVADMEALRDLRFWRRFATEVRTLHYVPIWYGSLDASPPAADEAEFRLLALPDGVPTIPDGYQGKQFRWGVSEAGGVIDLSVLSEDLYKLGGIGPRHAPGLAATIRAAAARIIPHTTAPVVAQTGDTPVSVAETIKQFVDDHAAELESLLGDAGTVLTAIDPEVATLAEAAESAAAALLAKVKTASAPVTTPPAAEAPVSPAGTSDAA